MQNFYQGIVEDNNDPLKLYRCRVRIFGIHTENKTDKNLESYIPVSDLPWADVLMNGSGMDGEGEFIPINKGSMVVISFFDPAQQKPIIIGTLPRYINKLPNFEEGFSDPDKIHPKSDNLNESSISRLARNEKINQTIIQEKIDNVKKNIDCNGETWNEPESQYGTVYPNNRIIQTKNHIFELDDTDGKERIHVYHKTGSSKEYHPNGDIVNITKSKKYEIIISDNNILIEGNQNVRIVGDQNIKIVGDENKNVANQTIKIDGDQNIEASTSITLKAPDINLDGLVNILNGLEVLNGKDANFSGPVGLEGPMTGSGSINLIGSIIDGGINTNHHSHI